MKRHQKLFVRKVEEIENCGNDLLSMEASVLEKPFEIEYFPDEKHNLDNCDICKKSHKIIYKETSEYFDKFPFCCDNHSKLVNAEWFNKDDYKDLPKWVADKVMFTFHHILNNLDQDNWKIEITNYIEYAVQSFGSLPVEYGGPIAMHIFFGHLEGFLDRKYKGENAKYNDRRLYILNILKSYFEPKKEKSSNFNIIIDIYNKWYNIFPFDIPLFSGLKSHFSNNIRIIMEKPIYNPYLGTHKAQLITKDRLLDYLLSVTKQILSKIDTTKLRDNNYINDDNKYKLDIISKEHQMKQSTLLKKHLKGEKRYIKTIKKWLSNEKEFLTQANPIIQSIRLENGTTKNHTFKTLIDKKKQTYILNLLDNLSITKDNIFNLSNKRKGAIRGIVEALRENNILPDIGIHKLSILIADEIKLEIKSKLDFSYTSNKYRKDANQYIKDNPLH